MPLAIQPPVDQVCRSTLDRSHSLVQGMNFVCFLVEKRRQDHVYVIRHDHCHLQFVILSVVVAATRKHDVSRARRKDPTELCNERDEMRCEVLLEMR